MDFEAGRKQPTEEQERKEARTNMDHDISEFSFSPPLSDQERINLNVFATIQENDEEGEEDDMGDDAEELLSYQSFENEYAFFEGHEFDLEMELLEGQGSNSEGDEGIYEDDIDFEDLSYEELIALGEVIGEQRRGFSMTQIAKCLTLRKYCSSESKLGIDIDKCVVCQVEFEDGESLAVLGCEHPYHYECISKWLQIKKICPICSSEISCHKTI